MKLFLKFCCRYKRLFLLVVLGFVGSLVFGLALALLFTRFDEFTWWLNDEWKSRAFLIYALVCFALVICQESAQFCAKNMLYKLSIKVELFLYVKSLGLFGASRYVSEKTLVLAGIPLFVRAGRALFLSLPPFVTCCGIAVLFAIEYPALSVIVMSLLLAFGALQVFLSNIGRATGKSFDEANYKRRLFINRAYQSLESYGDELVERELREYEHAFTKRMLFSDVSRILTVFTVAVVGFVLLLSMAVVSLDYAVSLKSVPPLLMSVYLVFQLSAFAGGLSTYFLLRSHVLDVENSPLAVC